MPELTEEMYCHQQICIPPMYPYLLRQYAKAAIRSQPIDLLKWSTAYFRCLSLNVPPPVKPRLEYPIPRDYVGMTPGWLKALNYQLQNNRTVPFKILWDRWIGACLQHETLIKILCLGGFTDVNGIPWNRFLGLCAGFLSDNLTQTMILVCEILTEEPEGGSAMITLETFLDVYKFLAAIDASKPQILYNLYFTDSALNLFEKEKKKRRKAASIEDLGSTISSEVTPEEIMEEQEPELTDMGEGSIVSCPDISSDDALKEPDLDKEKSEELIAAHKLDSSFHEDKEEVTLNQLVSLEELEERKATDKADEKEGEDGEGDKEEKDEEGEEHKEEAKADEEEDEEGEKKVEDEENIEEAPKEPEDDDEEREIEVHSPKESGDKLEDVAQDILERGGIEIDEEQQEGDAEEGTEMEEDKELSLPDAKHEPIDPFLEELQGEDGMYRLDELDHRMKIQYQDVGTDHDLVQDEVMEEEEAPEEVHVEAIPGIGPIVPDELVEAVEKYLTKVSAEEHGMTMPRHIRHYTCPPLEVLA